jgi:hypothetical protein
MSKYVHEGGGDDDSLVGDQMIYARSTTRPSPCQPNFVGAGVMSV